jgi:hypothetical protein
LEETFGFPGRADAAARTVSSATVSLTIATVACIAPQPGENSSSNFGTFSLILSLHHSAAKLTQSTTVHIGAYLFE